MDKIFVAGAYFHTDKSNVDIYEQIGVFLQKKYPTKQIFTPKTIVEYRHNYKLKNPDISEKDLNKAMVDYDLKQVTSAGLVIADITNKSTGLGIELGTIRQTQNKIVFLIRDDAEASNMILGLFCNAPTYKYNPKNLKDTILKICKEHID